MHCGRHVFGQVCDAHGIADRLIKPCHPWTSGQAGRLNRTLKEAAVKVDYYATHEAFNVRLQAFLWAYHFAKRLKTLRGLTPHEFVYAEWYKASHYLSPGPDLHSLELYT